jgi:hypothetical protein
MQWVVTIIFFLVLFAILAQIPWTVWLLVIIILIIMERFK